MPNKIIPFEELEKDLMNKILEEDTPVNKILRQQYESCTIESRDFTGKGVFTNFKVEDDNLLNEIVEYDYATVDGKINDIDVGFILFVTNEIYFLEGFTYGDIWPDTILSYELYMYEKHKISESFSTFVKKPGTLIQKPIK